MPSVFVSHSSLDDELVRRLIVEPLEQHGLTVWYARDSIHAAEEWEKRIRQALAGTEWFLVALSSNSVRSEWVRAEVDWAMENRRGKLVPVLIGECEPQECHLRLRQIQYIDLRGAPAQGRAALLKVWGVEQPPPVPVALERQHQHRGGIAEWPQRVWTRRSLRWLAVGVLALVALVAAGSLFRGPVIPERRDARARDSSTEPPTTTPAQVAAIAPQATKALGAQPAAPESAPAPPPLSFELGLPVPPKKPRAENDPVSDVCVTYHYERQDSALHIFYRLPYLERQRAGKVIRGISFDDGPFQWDLPVLSIKVLNHSSQSIMLTECRAEVTASRADTEPILVVADRAVNALMLVNEGWGDVVDPVLTFKIHALEGKDKPEISTLERHTLELKTFDKVYRVPLVKYVPEALADEPSVAVSGDLEFGPAGGRKKVPFATTMIFEIVHGAPVPPSYTYDLALKAGVAPVTVAVPIAQNFKPGEADHFLLRIASDKSAHYEMRLTFRSIEGRALSAKGLVLDTFVSRSMAKRIEKGAAEGGAPPAE